MRRTALSFTLIAATAAAQACGGSPEPLATPGGAATATASLPAAPSSTAAAEAPSPPSPAADFHDPGGMWAPQQIGEQADTLEKLGLQVDPAQLSDPTSPLLSSIVSLGGCSASFVSPDGLIVTNHHCVQAALQFSSTPDHNLIHDGFLATSRADERPAGPTQHVYVTRATTDVTARVRDGLDAIKSDLDRFKAIEDRTKKIVAECESGRPEVRCSVRSFFEGAQYSLVEQLDIRDVRLVYAPAYGIGDYGGEVDNWRWPRHAGDFSFFRAYVGKDGKPADPSPDNVPFHPQHHLTVARQPVRASDLVLVAGYPARTSRLQTAGEVADAVSWLYPRRIERFSAYLDMMAKLTDGHPDLAIKANSLVRGYGNALTNNKGQLEALGAGGLLADRQKQEHALREWIDADPARKTAHGGALEAIDAIDADAAKTRDADAMLAEIVGTPRLLGAAETLVRIAEERPKADAARDPDYQQRNWDRIRGQLSQAQKSYDRRLDVALLSLALRRALALPEAQRPRLVASVLGKNAKPDDVQAAVEKLYATTTLEDEKGRVAMFDKVTLADLRASKDPLLRLALEARPALKAAEDRDKAKAGAMARVRPKYLAALREFQGGMLAPDANGTLRITYGTVRGYKPRADASEYRPFSLLAEVVAKNTGKDPFEAPPALLRAAAQPGRTAPYVDRSLGDVPVDFLSDVDTTGGNSGSATLDARGELVGLLFDGTIESMGSDWLFQPQITRSIHVDLRYVLWVMDAVDGAHALMREMGVEPRL